MDTPKNTQAFALGSALIMATALIALPVFANDDDDNGPRIRTVNCHSDDASIQEQINEIGPGRKAVIFIKGQCEENVLIEKDDITLSGNKDGDGTIDGGVTGTITVVGARRVTIEYLHITGPNQGITARDGATVRISRNEITDNEGDGIDAGNNATVISNGNYIAGNRFAAVEVGNAIHWRSEGDDIIIQAGCKQGDIADTNCGKEDTIAVDCFRNGSCHVRDADITGSSFVSGFSYLDITNTVLNGNIGVATGSGIRFRAGVAGTGFVDCFLGEGAAFQNATCDAPVPAPPPPPAP